MWPSWAKSLNQILRIFWSCGVVIHISLISSSLISKKIWVHSCPKKHDMNMMSIHIYTKACNLCLQFLSCLALLSSNYCFSLQSCFKLAMENRLKNKLAKRYVGHRRISTYIAILWLGIAPGFSVSATSVWSLGFAGWLLLVTSVCLIPSPTPSSPLNE